MTKYFAKSEKGYQNWAYPKYGTREPGLLVGPDTRDPGSSHWWDPRPGTLKVGPKTRDPGPNSIRETWGPTPETLKMAPETRSLEP